MYIFLTVQKVYLNYFVQRILQYEESHCYLSAFERNVCFMVTFSPLYYIQTVVWMEFIDISNYNGI